MTVFTTTGMSTATNNDRPKTTSIYTIRNTKSYQQLLQSKLDTIRSYGRPLTPAYHGSAYSVSHSVTCGKGGSATHVLNVPISRVIHCGLLRPELDASLLQHQHHLDAEAAAHKHATVQRQAEMHDRLKQQFERIRVKNQVRQHQAGLRSTSPDTTILATTDPSPPQWQNVTISRRPTTSVMMTVLTEQQRQQAIERMDAKNALLYRDAIEREQRLTTQKKQIKSLFSQQKHRNAQRDEYLSQKFDSDEADVQHIVRPDTVSMYAAEAQTQTQTGTPSAANSRRASRRASHGGASARNSLRPQSAQSNGSAARPMSAAQQVYLDSLASPSSRYSQPADAFMYHTHRDYNGLVDDNIVQIVNRQRRASQHADRQRRASQQLDLTAYHMLLSSLNTAGDVDGENSFASPRQYFAEPSKAEQAKTYVDRPTHQIANEIDAFEAQNAAQLIDTLHVR